MASSETAGSATAVLLANDQHAKDSTNQVKDSLNLVRDSLNQVRDSVNQVKDSVHQLKDAPHQAGNSSISKDPKGREVTIRFRWYVTLPTKASQILFNCPFSVVPIAMAPKKLNGSDVYESSDMTVPCGTYSTCTLTVDSKKHVLEAVEIKHYSFEIDLYIDENDDDEEPAVAVNTSHNSVSKQLPLSQPSFSQPCDVMTVATVTNGDEFEMDDVIEDVGQSGQTSSRSLQRLNALESLLRQQIANRGPAAEESAQNKSLGSGREAVNIPERNSERRNFDATKNGSKVDGKVRDHIENQTNVENSTKTNAPIPESEIVNRRFEPIRTPLSVVSSNHPDCDWLGAGDEVVQDSSMSSSFVSEPELRQFAATVRKSELARGGAVIHDAGGVGQKNLELAKEQSVRSRSVDILVGRKNLKDTIVGSSGHHQELDLARSQSSDYGNRLRSATQPSNQSPLERRASSGLGSQEKIATEVRVEQPHQPSSYGSEYHEKVGSSEMVSPSRNGLDPGRLTSPKPCPSLPTLRSPLVTSRTTPISSGPPRIGAAHHAPVVVGPKDTLLHREEFGSQQDLEDVVRSLKDLVKERDGQIEELRQENRHLQSLLTEAKETSLENEDKRVRELIRDKENLATQLWKVQQDLEHFTAEANKKSSESGDNPQTNGLDNYNCNNPAALQRKLDDLHSHLQDLQEANETASAKLEQAEKVIASLRNENNILQTTSENSLEEIHKQNSLLKEQLHRLQNGHWTDNSRPLHEEIQVLREDLRILRDKNHHLVQDNIKLTEYIKDLQQLNGYTSPTRQQDGHADLTRSDGVHLVSWKPKSQGYSLVEEKENYSTSGQRLKNEIRSPSPTRNYPPPPDVSLRSPPRLLKSNSGFLSNTRDHWLDIDSADSVQQPAESDAASFVGEYGCPRRDSLRSDNTLVSSSHMDVPSDYDRNDRHFKAMESELLHSSPYDAANRRWSVPKHNGNVNKGAEVPLPKKTPVFNASSHSIDRVPSAVAPSVVWTRSSRSDFKSSADSYANQSPDLDLNVKKTTLVSLKPDLKRLSICSNSTENILLEADLMLSASRSSVTQKPVSAPIYKNDVSSSSSVPKLNDQKPKDFKISEAFSIPGKFSKEHTFPACSKRPFAPRLPSDISLGDLVKFSRNGGHISKGQVKFIGHLPGKSDTYLGVELDNEMGKHDGVFEGTRYFQCKPNKGVFVAFCKVVMAWCD